MPPSTEHAFGFDPLRLIPLLPGTVSWMQAKDIEALRSLGGVVGLAKAIGSHEHDGLDPSAAAGTAASVQEHSRVYGPNRYKEVPPKSFFALCFENIQDPIILLLIAAALVRSSRPAGACCALHSLQLRVAWHAWGMAHDTADTRYPALHCTAGLHHTGDCTPGAAP